MESINPNRMAEFPIQGTGHTTEATPHRQKLAQEELDNLYEYHRKAQTHLWLVLLTHRASGNLLDAHDATVAYDGSDAPEERPELPMLDVDTLIGLPALVCYICELAYTPRDRRRKCPGDPLTITPKGRG